MYLVTKYSVDTGICDADTLHRLDSLLIKYALDPMLYSAFAADDMARAALHDKKIRGSSITLVFPNTIGRAELKVCPLTEIDRISAAGNEN